MMSRNIRRNKTPVAIFSYESLVDNTSATELNPAFRPSRFVETNRLVMDVRFYRTGRIEEFGY